jgi:hypothetical protein
MVPLRDSRADRHLILEDDMQKAPLAVSLIVGLSLIAQAAAAQTQQWQLGPQVNFATSNVGLGIGGRAVYTGLGSAVKAPGLAAYASFDIFFPSGGSIWEINANATWDIPHVTGGSRPYVGAGLDYAHDGSSLTGLNLLGGIHFKPTPVLNMFGEVRIELRTNAAIVFTFGALF